jgi:hypothetical protein
MRPARLLGRSLFSLLFALAGVLPAGAQEPPPPIPLFVVDVHATFPKFPINQAIVDSRDLDSIAELPGAGLGVLAGMHFYLLRWRAVTFGLGGEVTLNRARQQPADTSTGLLAVEEKFLSAAPQLSFNFGTGHGWSYLSGGVGVSQWSVIPDGRAEPFPSDTDRLRTFNYGGGARWFAKNHLAFSLDVRFYAVSEGTPYLDHPGSPKHTFLIASVGISVK